MPHCGRLRQAAASCLRVRNFIHDFFQLEAAVQHALLGDRTNPLPSLIFRLRSAFQVTGVLAVPILYEGAEPTTRLLEADPSLQRNEPTRLPAKTDFNFQYLNPSVAGRVFGQPT